MKDIAAEAGVSTRTVFKVLNNKGGISRETQACVREIAKQMGYNSNFATRSLRMNSTHKLGVVSDTSYCIF